MFVAVSAVGCTRHNQLAMFTLRSFECRTSNIAGDMCHVLLCAQREGGRDSGVCVLHVFRVSAPPSSSSFVDTDTIMAVDDGVDAFLLLFPDAHKMTLELLTLAEELCCKPTWCGYQHRRIPQRVTPRWQRGPAHAVKSIFPAFFRREQKKNDSQRKEWDAMSSEIFMRTRASDHTSLVT
jgi:hypothetical protein